MKADHADLASSNKMNLTVIPILASGVISGFVGLAVALITAHLTKSREHQADWRRLKLELYREYILATSGIMVGRDSPEAQARYSGAFNALALVAPPRVLEALYELMDETSYRNANPSPVKQTEIRNRLIDAIRQDVYPGAQPLNEKISYRLIDIPPSSTRSTDRT